MRIVHVVVSFVLFAGGAVFAQAEDAVLRVTYSGKTTVITSSDLASMRHEDVTAMDFHEKRSHTYTGVPVRDLLARAGVPLGEKMRGPAFKLAVTARTRDNYEVVYALAEFDEAFNGRTILLVDREDGHVLGDGMGPVRIVVPGDKRPARWARMVTSLDVLSVGDASAR
jgi:hypothetical protein